MVQNLVTAASLEVRRTTNYVPVYKLSDLVCTGTYINSTGTDTRSCEKLKI